jgi:hypothetical protein
VGAFPDEASDEFSADGLGVGFPGRAIPGSTEVDVEFSDSGSFLVSGAFDLPVWSGFSSAKSPEARADSFLSFWGSIFPINLVAGVILSSGAFAEISDRVKADENLRFYTQAANVGEGLILPERYFVEAC